ncbi:flagellin [Gammaproteobacteria bacterium]|nr:flagellin [Gammaproteobacteria bacterium]
MGMVLNTNIGSIQAQRALNESRKDMEKAMERLATGSRINSAADDAAGLSMVERMTTQIRGLTMATRNANDGIALIKTVENALVEVSGMLQRMRELAVQSSSDTSTSSARTFANNEFNQLQLEISRVSLNTRYNGAQVLNGSFAAKSLQVGTQSGETLEFSIGNAESTQLGAYVIEGKNTAALAGNSGVDPTNAATAAQDITITSGTLTRVIDVELNDTAKLVAKKINSVAGSTQVVGEARSFAWLYTSTASPAVSGKLKINGTETAAFTITSNDVSDAIAKINLISTSTGVQATTTGDYKILLSDSDGDDIVLSNISDRADLKVQSLAIDALTANSTVITLADGNPAATGDTANIRGNLRLTSTSDFSVTQADSDSYFANGLTSSPLVDISSSDVLTRITASNALAILDGAISRASSMRGGLGTLQNRLEYTVSNLMKVTEFTTGARSRISDADFAAETSRLAKAQVLQQAGAAMLAQANGSTDIIMQLLRA